MADNGGIDPARPHLPRCIGAAAIGDVLQPDAGAQLDQFPHEMADMGVAGRAIGDLPGPGAGGGEKTLKILGREILVHGQIIGLRGDLGDRGEGGFVIHRQ